MGAGVVGGLQLDVPERNLFPGQFVRGVINFMLQSDLQADTLVLKFKGKEYVEWKEVQSHGKNNVQVHTYRGHHMICMRRFPIFLFEGGNVKAGSYSFPFEVQLPSHVPGSFEKNGKMMRAVISYNLTALIENVKTVKRAKVDLSLAQTFTDVISSVEDEVKANIKSCCCVSKGEVRMKAYFNKNAFNPNESAEVHVQIDNSRSKAAVVRVKVELQRLLSLRDDTGRRYGATSTLSTSHANVRIAARQPFDPNSSTMLLLPIEGNKGELESAATVSGTCFECIHSVRVQAFMSGWFKCCGQKPRVERLIKIFPPQLPPTDVMVAPLEWHPTVMRMVTLPYNAPEDNLKDDVPEKQV